MITLSGLVTLLLSGAKDVDYFFISALEFQTLQFNCGKL